MLGDFANEVMLCIRYYGVTFRGHPPERLILTGGDGLEPRLGETLADQCKVPVSYDDEGSLLDSVADAISGLLQRPAGPSACWAVAAGLSLRGLSVNKRRLIRAPLARRAA